MHGGGRPSLFDGIKKDDLVIAFFPCIYFCANNVMIFTGIWHKWKMLGYNDRQKNEYILQRSKERERFYSMALKLFTICSDNGVRLIMENPATEPHYLTNNFPYKPSFIDTNRQRRGDYFRKPTAYWFLNCSPVFGLQTNEIPTIKKVIQKLGGHEGNLCDEDRSMIAPAYARNFICDFILGKDQGSPKQEELF